IFLDLLRKITKPQATHLVIPSNNRAAIFLRRILTDPVIDFFISRAGGDEFFEFHCVESRKFPKIGTEAARIRLVLAIDTEQIGSSLVEHPCGNDEPAECVTRAVRWCFP